MALGVSDFFSYMKRLARQTSLAEAEGFFFFVSLTEKKRPLSPKQLNVTMAFN